MKKQKANRFWAIAVSTLVLVVYGCGVGGSGSSTPPAAPGTKSASAGATSAQQAVLAGKIGLSSLASGAKAPRLNMSKGGDLNALIASFTKDINIYRAKAVAFAPQSATCAGGGTMTFDSTTTSMTITYAACITPTTGATEYQDGTITISFSTGSFSIGMSNYTDRMTSTSGTLLSENISNFTMSGTSSGATLSCGTMTLQNTFSLTMDGTISDKEDTNADGTLDVNMSSKMTSFKLDVLINALDNICNPTDSTITMSGGISSTNNIQANDSIGMTIAAANPLTITAVTVTGGENVTISGTFATTSSCFNGSFTIATPTPVFYPTASESPTSGKIVITGDITGTVTYTSTGDVQVDEGSDGTVDKTYPSGTPIEACVG